MARPSTAPGAATTLLLATLAMLAPPAARARRAPGDTRPNIVLFHPDTIRAESIAAYGHPLSRTPNFDALAAQGVLFEQAHVQHTQCGPSRCAMVTGRYMHVLGHRTQTHLVRGYEDNFAAQLKAAGYTTILLGKNDMFAPSSFNSSLTYWDGIIGVGTGPSNFSFNEAGYYSFSGSAKKNCNSASLNCNGDLEAANLTARFMLDVR
jgi:choline-sulfatase